MRTLIQSGIFFIFMLFSANVVAQAATYYVRVDGGTPLQCNGTTDAAYPRSGSNQPCAFNHPFWVLSAAGSPNKMVGGDTLVIGPGQYMMGFGAPNTPSCSQYYPWDCSMRAVPSGTASNPTRILGKGWDTGCSSKPQLWGTERAASILDLRSSNNVQVQCLDITDHSNCMDSGPDPLTRCNRDVYPFGPWAMMGIVASDSSNVLLKNVRIHGLRSGILAGRLSNWTIEKTDIIANSFVGWDGDIGASVSSNDGTIAFKNSRIMWNGCGETYPGLQPHHCYSQDQGGYGDGLGTNTTGGDWVFDHVDFSHNTSDGLDLLYHNGDGSITVSHSRFEGNAGNQIKVAAKTVIDNSKIIGNCSYFNGKSFTSTTDVSFSPVAFNNCRAAGNTIAVDFHPGMQVAIYNSTITGNGDVLVQSGGNTCLSTDKIISKNNIYIGGPEYNTGGQDVSDLYYAAGAGGNGDGTCGKIPFNTADDIIWATKYNSTKCTGNSSKCVDPKITGSLSSAGDNLDVSLKQGSPAIGAAAFISGFTKTDFNNFERGGQWDIGAFEYGSVPRETDSTPIEPPPDPDGTPTTKPVCGNAIVETPEQCDGSALKGQTCASLGYFSGTLACSSSCLFNTFNCTNCGNGVINSGEQCDGSNLAGKTCVSQGFTGGTLGCSSCALNTSACTNNLCGNSIVNSTEQCDGSNLNGKTCSSLGYGGGTLGCSSSCSYNTSGCDSCGNGSINAGEQCDGSNLNGKTCASLGYAGGTLGCTGSCAYNVSGCGTCGNGVLDAGEQCDGANLSGQSCATLGQGGGALSCSGSCTFNISGCNKCGNGVLDSNEQCDGNNLGGKSCSSLGYISGSLSCTNGCTLNTSECSSCGDGSVDSGEQCDGGDLAGQTCVSLGFKAGFLGCKSNCEYNTYGCTNISTPVCGNSVKELDEQCDGLDFGGMTCESIGYSRGTLGCTSYCQYNVLGCK